MDYSFQTEEEMSSLATCPYGSKEFAFENACRRDDPTKVHALLQEGFDVNKILRKSVIPNGLFRACHETSNRVIPVLLDAPNIDVNYRNLYGDSALHFCARSNSFAIPLLIEANAEVNAVNNSKWRPLDWALSKGDGDSVQHLVDVGCELSEDDLENLMVKKALQNNAKRRDAALTALLHLGLTERTADSHALPYAFLAPRDDI